MDKPHDTSHATSLARTLQRRLAPVKLAIQMLHHEIDARSEGRLAVERTALDNLVSTLELFVEDVEAEIGAPKAPAVTNGDRRATLMPEKSSPRLTS